MKKRLGEILIEAGHIDDIQLSVALGMQRQTGSKLGAQLLKLGFVDEKKLSAILRGQLGIKLNVTELKIPAHVLKTVPQALAFKYKVVPVAFDGKVITVATADPLDLDKLDSLAFQLGKKLRPIQALEWDIDDALIRHYLDFSDSEMGKLTSTSKVADQYRNMDWTFGNIVSIEPAKKKAPPEQAKAGRRPEKKAGHGQAPEEAPRQAPEEALVELVDEALASETSVVLVPPMSEEQSFPHVRLQSPEDEAERPAHKDAASKDSKSNVLNALIELLVRKKLITEKELLGIILSLERDQKAL